MAGDFGFDPLGLGQTPANLARFQEVGSFSSTPIFFPEAIASRILSTQQFIPFRFIKFDVSERQFVLKIRVGEQFESDRI